MANRAFFAVALGHYAIAEASMMVRGLRRQHPELRGVVVSDGPCQSIVADGTAVMPPPYECDSGGRLAKLLAMAYLPSGVDQFVYLDADTRVNSSIEAGFSMLSDGFDLVIAPSDMQGDDLLWHVGPNERATTLEQIVNPYPLQLQAGVWFMAVNPDTRLFMANWQVEWLRWRDQDQAAMLRALHREPLKIALLGSEFNGGTVIAHRHGMARP